MTLDVFLLQLANGLSFGIIFALIASGIPLMWGFMDFINMAHGELYILGAYGVWLALVIGVGSFWLVLPVAVVGVLAAGLLLRITMLRPIFDRPPLHTLLATSEIRSRLAPRAAAGGSPVDEAASAVNKGVEGVKKIFR